MKEEREAYFLQKKLSGVESNGNKVLSMDRNKNIYCALVMVASKVAAPTCFCQETKPFKIQVKKISNFSNKVTEQNAGFNRLHFQFKTGLGLDKGFFYHRDYFIIFPNFTLDPFIENRPKVSS